MNDNAITISNGVDNLICGVFEQAVKDYGSLLKKGTRKAYDTKCGMWYSATEIERFFRSPWCELMLNYMGLTETDGYDVIDILRQRFKKKKD